MFQQNFRIFLGFSKTDSDRYTDSYKHKGKADNRQKNDREFGLLRWCFNRFYIFFSKTDREKDTQREDRQLDRRTTKNLEF